MTRFVPALALLLALCACYTTRVRTPVASGEPREVRQWFLLAGTRPMSDAAGVECLHGTSEVTTEFTWTDAALSLGIGLVGGGVGFLACDASDAQSQIECARTVAIGSVFVVEPRTVRYRCAP